MCVQICQALFTKELRIILDQLLEFEHRMLTWEWPFFPSAAVNNAIPDEIVALPVDLSFDNILKYPNRLDTNEGVAFKRPAKRECGHFCMLQFH